MVTVVIKEIVFREKNVLGTLPTLLKVKETFFSWPENFLHTALPATTLMNVLFQFFEKTNGKNLAQLSHVCSDYDRLIFWHILCII
jgi:hypothetical protein